MKPALQEAWRLYTNGDTHGARRTLEACLLASPQEAEAHFLLGLVEIEAGFVARGLRRIEERAAAYTPAAAICQRLGEMRFEQGEHARADAWLRRALAQDPALAPAWATLGNVLRMRGDPAAAEQAFRRSMALAPGEEAGYVGLAFLLRAIQRNSEAATTMLELARAAPDNAEVLEKVMAFLEELRRPDLAVEVGQRLAVLVPGDAKRMVRIGRLHEKLGQFEDAARCYRRAIELDPGTDVAYLGLSVIRRFTTADDPDAQLIDAALARDDLGESSTTCAHFALGKILDDCGDFPRAFEHLRIANAQRARTRPFDTRSYLENMRRIRAAFTAETLQSVPPCPPGSPTPVFVVGMMRSGTTLVERILDSHPQVHGAGELNLVGEMAGALGLDASDATVPAHTPLRLEAGQLRQLARGYLESLAGIARGEPMVVDKNPGNFAYLGLLAVLFPHAKFVHCSRDPLDTCLSIYFQHFAREANAWTYDLRAIGEVYADYQETMAHWESVMPGQLIDVRYEALVQDSRTVTRSLLERLGLPFDAACLEPHRNLRPVGTASVWQARQPIYLQSLGKWRHYAAQLAPLREQLLAAGVALDTAAVGG